MDLGVPVSTGNLEQLPKSAPEASSNVEVSLSKDELERWLENIRERAERQGNSEAKFTLGQYLFGRGHYGEAIDLFERASSGVRDAGSSQAKYQLGVMYYEGLGVSEDTKKGFGHMLEVAQSTLKRDANLISSAQYNVGRAYFMGFGVSQSDQEAERWWVRAGQHGSDQSSLRAQNSLGMFYACPETKNTEESFHWHSLAAENGHLESMAALGLLFRQREPSQAVGGQDELKWLKRSAIGGCVYGLGLLAHVYYTRKLFSKAAETAFQVSELKDRVPATDHSQGEEATPFTFLERRGIAIGCFVLARCLQLGQAVTRNEEKAHQYYSKATMFDKAVAAHLYGLLIHGLL